MQHFIRQPDNQKRAMRLFLVGCFVVTGAMVTGIMTSALRHPRSFLSAEIEPWQQAIVILIALATALMVFKRLRSWAVWEAFFTATLFLGIWYAALLVLPLPYALSFAAAITLFDLLVPRVWSHDIFYIIGASGVAISLSLWLPGDVLLVWLVGFSLYDILAGPPGGPILDLASRLVGHGVIPGLVVIGRPQDALLPLKLEKLGHTALLGAGDLVLPMALVARAALAGIYPALAVLAGVVVGALVLSRGDMLHPRAALPALAAGASVPFIILRFLSVV
ncbi:hypothetical protein HZC53_02095 [Candidatus Uhrbacteria bacterium]|nr:hypothetical protein [Candidatus Uhrbacteria bacterium]